MTSKISKILMEEHKQILKVADAIENECGKIPSEKRINEEFFKNAVYFIKNYADKFHHAKEENILFKELCKKEIQKKIPCSPIQQMLHEHDIGRDFVRGIENGLKNKEPKKIAENAIGYANLIKEHIYKEDNILYPMADQSMNKKIQELILKNFEKEEKKMSGEKDKCLKILKELIANE